MSIVKSKDKIKAHKQKALSKIESYLDSLIASNNPIFNSKADKLCYWFEDYMKWLTYEPSFNASSLRRYKRGEVIKVHLGYNIGSEEGGLHYAVVLDKNNSIHCPVITILPLTSVKATKDMNALRVYELNLGNELYSNLSSKITLKKKEIIKGIKDLQSNIEKLPEELSTISIEALSEKKKHLLEDLKSLEKMYDEINKMKTGSIALINQIRVISKIRIYDPKTNYDVLSGIRLSNKMLDSIDECIINSYTGKNGKIT